ncbi:unnamed protein product [Heligmosomoides polygyrus]|uniref:Uncharacterized protein n=1 Tax=Heligmosomoides polygyrus TaxID=6339 RepID=A0A3P8H5C7_HELPZ|nr:unnamed protein product [Heligmosomoides polygyrus]
MLENTPTPFPSYCPECSNGPSSLEGHEKRHIVLPWLARSSANPLKTADGDADLVMSDQGYGLMTTSKVPRAATPQPVLRTCIDANQLDWDKLVVACTFMYNTPHFQHRSGKHDLERNIPILTDSSLHVANPVATLHVAWKTAAVSNDHQRTKYKKQFDALHFSPLTIKLGDHVHLRDFAATLGLSQKLCMPVTEISHPYLTILSISAAQSKSKKVHMNQVKPCFELSGPVFTSPWQPDLEQLALTAADASEVALTGSAHDIDGRQTSLIDISSL